MANGMSRRGFLRRCCAGAAGPLIVPRLSLAQPPSGRLQHAAIGVGGMGWNDLNSIVNAGRVDVVALCDVDANNLEKAAAKFPKAKQYRDWRELLAQEAGRIDSVNVATPDHMHAPIAKSALDLGKHVYCQKPLTHEVFEARQLTLAARAAGVVTQMGIQIHAHIAYRMGAAMLRDGVIGKIREWHSWSASCTTPPCLGVVEGQDEVPATLDWDHWIGVAPMRPYKTEIYHPFTWRGWKDFGTGSLGDFGCHIFDPIFTALHPDPPLRVRAEVSNNYGDVWPEWEIVHYEFPGNAMTVKDTIKATWYDGGKQPPRELAQLPEGRDMPGSGSLVIGEDGVMLLPHWAGPTFYPEEKFKKLDRPKFQPRDHYAEWVYACLGEGSTGADFDYSGPLAEAVLLGNIANRFPGQTLEWDAPTLAVTNSEEATARVRRAYREGWEVKGLSG